MKLNQKVMEKENQKIRYSQKIANEKDRMETEMKIKMWEEKYKAKVRHFIKYQNQNFI